MFDSLLLFFSERFIFVIFFKVFFLTYCSHQTRSYPRSSGFDLFSSSFILLPSSNLSCSLLSIQPEYTLDRCILTLLKKIYDPFWNLLVRLKQSASTLTQVFPFFFLLFKRERISKELLVSLK